MSKPVEAAETVFSKIIRGALPCAKVHEDDATFVLMDAGQLNPGHVLVVLKRPAETILDLSADEHAALYATVHKLARAVQRAFLPEGITILQTNKPAGWQTVPHVHVHVVPRYEGDGVGLVWPRKNPPLDELKSIAAKIEVVD